MKEIPYVSEITIATRGLSLPSFAYSPPSYTDTECIHYIRYLPENVMMYEHGIYLSAADSEELKFMLPLLKNYHYLADWLEYFILKDSKRINLFSCPNRKAYKPIADLSLARMRLIQEVCLFIPWHNSQTISINRWWFTCEWEQCLNLLSESGFTGNPSLIGASENYKLTLAQDKQWNSIQARKTDIGIYEATPMQALEELANLISQHRDNILFRTHFAHYRKIKKRVANTLRKSKLNPAYLNRGQFHLMQKGKPGKKEL